MAIVYGTFYLHLQILAYLTQPTNPTDLATSFEF